MFKRPHHQRIAQLLAGMDAALLREARCYFAGGTAIALQLEEFRESIDIDFLCADQAGYRMLRAAVFDHGLAALFPTGIEIIREMRADRDGIRAVLAVEAMPVKFEIVREARISLEPADVPGIPVPCLSRIDLFAEKLLANADRYGDKSALSRDVIDILVMRRQWGDIPAAAWHKARSAYGQSVDHALDRAFEMLRNHPDYLANCLSKMGVDAAVGNQIRQDLANWLR